LINQLRTLDQEGSFPHFMELPSELRLSVYELLLVDTTEVDQLEQPYKVAWNSIIDSRRFNDNTLHPAVLRASKRIYSEAMSILYTQNEFSAKIVYHERGSLSRRRSMFDGCNLILVRPGGRHFYHQIMWSNPRLRNLFVNQREMGMMRAMTHLTINIDLVPPEEISSQRHVSQAGEALASLCLSLTGASNMKELTVSVDPEDLNISKVDLAHILWPLMLLRTNVVVKFKGLATVTETALAHLTIETEAEESLGSKIAEIRRGCHKMIKTRGEDVNGIRDVEAALRDLSHFRKWLLHIDDIVGLSAKWRGIRSQADRVEAKGAKGLEKESLS
jgi:hypothetical protein